MTAPTYVRLERVSHTSPFGVGLWDEAAGRLVSDDIAVTVHTLSAAGIARSQRARANRAGLFAAQDFGELRTFEAGSGDEAFWASQPPPRPYLVDVQDAAGRFTPFVMHLGIPERGLALPSCALDLWPASHSSPPSSAPFTSPPTDKPPIYVPLFSTAARTLPPRLAAVRAKLVDSASEAAATWAVVEVLYGGALLARGIADAIGQVVVPFAYPEPTTPLTTSPSGGSATAQPLTDQSWEIEVSFRYRASLPTYDVGTSERPVPLADLCEILQQPFTTARTSLSPLSAPITGDKLHYGEELTLAGAPLFIDPA